MIANRLDEMRRVERWLSDLSNAWDLDTEVAFAVDLVINEAVTNVIRHAFPDRESHRIRIALRNEEQAVEIAVTDDGFAFDPLAYPDPAGALALDEADIGGRGIGLIKGFSVARGYARVAGENRLWIRVAKRFPELIARVARHALFEGVDPAEVGPLLRGCEERRLAVGEVLLEPGRPNRNLYLVLEGRLKVHLERLDSEEGFLIEAGECTGEISVVDSRPASAFVVASFPTRLLVVPEDRLFREVLRHPGVAKNFMRLFAARLRARTEVMQEALEHRLRYEHLQRELGIAREIQLGMLPHHLDIGPEVEIVAGMTPARVVGGDFFDVFPVGPDDYCVAIGDISGKGMPAALFMVRTMTLLRSELLIEQPIEEALRRINRRLCAENPTLMFATLSVALVGRHTGRVDFVCAGHEPAILGVGDRYRALDPPRGVLVGVSSDATYERSRIQLGMGDRLVLYTDGVTEAMSADRRPFTLDRLIDCLGTRGNGTAAELAGRVREALGEFTAGAPPSDDITLVILRWMGPARASDSAVSADA